MVTPTLVRSAVHGARCLGAAAASPYWGGIVAERRRTATRQYFSPRPTTSLDTELIGHFILDSAEWSSRRQDNLVCRCSQSCPAPPHTAPHRPASHGTAPHRTALHRTAPHRPH
ncbi:hypothetical protein E2C01_053548 [Portunus trituberculatus]|uniref:Uncharacterized protein n=1 Tax=Portunus trituberculatus TaxID=210409 RepID=A0A5B7GQD6_PORTR|nr:hypothetical protein [Portunus trituberculatus]